MQAPLISICIPHYNRGAFLLMVLDSIAAQEYPNLEILVSDDCSSDDSELLVKGWQEAHAGKVRLEYQRQETNRGYDANLRAALGMGRGDYLFVLGNDDALAAPDSLGNVVKALDACGRPAVAFVEFHDYDDPSSTARRAPATEVLGAGPDVALRYFRRFSFVGGLIFDRTWFERFDTEAYDGSVYFQMYLGTRIIAAGGAVAAIAESVVAKDVHPVGETVNSYRDTLRAKNARLSVQTGGLDQVGRCVCDGLLPSVPEAERAHYAQAVYRQLLLNSYANWLLDYRKQGVYRAAVNLAIGCFPTNLSRHTPMGATSRIGLLAAYSVATTGGLLAPLSLLERAKEMIIARRR